jgi:hypothetical protein
MMESSRANSTADKSAGTQTRRIEQPEQRAPATHLPPLAATRAVRATGGHTDVEVALSIADSMSGSWAH